jgi:hypothetical protein
MSNPTALVQKLWNYCNILPPTPLAIGGQAAREKYEGGMKN